MRNSSLATRFSVFFAATALSAASATVPAAADDAADWIKEIKPSVKLLYRAAVINEDFIPRDATASTLQTLASLETGEAFGLKGFVQIRNVSNIFANNVNDTLNGKTQFPVEPDPEATEIDQAYLSYSGVEDLTLSFGRKKLSQQNQRFVSFLPWRQNHVSYDGAFLDWKPTQSIELSYAYVFNINRIFTDQSPVGNFKGDFHLINAKADVPAIGKIAAYSQILDMDSQFALALSTRTTGVNITGKQRISEKTRIGYVLDFAHQTDIGNNPFSIDELYYRIEPYISYGRFTLRAGHETLGGNGERGFQTPLALLHGFNGWADRFLVTPAEGLSEIFLKAIYTLPGDGNFKKFRFFVSYHDFTSDVGNIDYGTEWNASISFRIFDQVNLLFKMADYNSAFDAFNGNLYSRDVTKFWFQAVTSF